MSDEAQKEREMLIEIARLNVMYEKAQQQVAQQVEELTALRKHSVKQVELVTQQAATIMQLRSALEKIVEVLTGDGLAVSYESSAGLIIAKAALVNAEDKP